jgi:hypothetical protein
MNKYLIAGNDQLAEAVAKRLNLSKSTMGTAWFTGDGQRVERIREADQLRGLDHAVVYLGSRWQHVPRMAEIVLSRVGRLNYVVVPPALAPSEGIAKAIESGDAEALKLMDRLDPPEQPKNGKVGQ